MRSIRAWCAVAVLLACCGVGSTATAQDTPAPLRVEESGMRFHLVPHTFLEVPVVNPNTQPISGKLTLSLLDCKDDSVIATRSKTVVEPAGAAIEKIDWPVGDLPSDTPSKLGWYRLQYTFEPDAGSGVASVKGIVQLGAITVDGFEMAIAGARRVAPGSKYPVRVHVENPTTHRPYAGLAVGLVLELGDDEETDVNRRVRTDERGNATVIFNLPSKPSDNSGEVKATMTRGAFSDHAALEFEFPSESAGELTITTDKPLYQPGQTVHVRLLAKDSQKHALAATTVELVIEDEPGNEQFHQKVVTSRFGIAAADWQIPSKIQLGTCTVLAQFDSSKDEYWKQSRSEIRISRYELPTFTVSVDPDRSYYLPGSNAVLDVHADYLFGKPVPHGKVRIVRQEKRQWDYKTQKWLVEESAPIEGELGSDGHFKVTADIAGEFEVFKKSNERFEDVTMAAYVTDSSTGRTEQRRFTIRISPQPIHLYVVSSDAPHRDQPFRMYVTSSYADGRPASVSGKIFAAQPTTAEGSPAGFDLTHRRQIGKFHTNRYGIARVEVSPLTESDTHIPSWYTPPYKSHRLDDSADDELEYSIGHVVIEALDSKGLSGQDDEDVTVAAKEEFVQVQTDHTLYHPGDSIRIAVKTNALQDAVLNVWADKGLLSSQPISLIHGEATAIIDYDVRFQGEILLIVSSMRPSSETERVLDGWAKVLYPARKELSVKVKMPKTTFKPGEDVSADVRVLTPDGRSTESALGLLVYDRAVAERVRADEDFGRDYGYSIFDYFDWHYQQSIGGISHRDLLNLDSRKSYPDGLDLVAEGMVRSEYDIWWAQDFLETSGWKAPDSSHMFEQWLKDKLAPARSALDAWNTANGEYPTDETDVRAALRAKNLDFDQLRDPWGRPFRMQFSVEGSARFLDIISSGVDKKSGTKDDFIAASFQWPYFRKIGTQIDRASHQYFTSTGRYIRDYNTLRDELKVLGTDLDALRDPWGRKYRFTFDVLEATFLIVVDSAGEDGIFNSKAKPSLDDAQVWSSNIHYFLNENAALNSALVDNFTATGTFPQNEEQLKPVLAMAKLGASRLIDPWGRPYQFRFSTQNMYADRLAIKDIRIYSEASSQSTKVTEVTPVTQQVAFISVVSNGPKNNPEDSFAVAVFSRVVAEQTSKDRQAVATGNQKPLAGASGSIRGTVTDVSGAAISHGEITAISEETGKSAKAVADDNGSYSFTGLPAGFYRLECRSAGFRLSVVESVPVRSGSFTNVDFTLNVGAVEQMVMVAAEPATLATETSEVASTADRIHSTELAKPLFTPRLRKYFPETLVWRPEVITDTHGRAHFQFSMADNITAWKMSVFASTEAGQVGLAERELHSFQPFFLENDPPKKLTEGDQISLPIVLRNYTSEPQTVSAEMQPAPWFTMISAAQQNVTVPAGGDASPVFTFRADHTVREGAQRVTARNSTLGDAVEREITVHPNGEEISFTSSRVLAGSDDSIAVQIPENAIIGSIDTEIRIYPNLMAQVLDTMHSIGQLPAGCAEQITSTAYMDLMALQLLQQNTSRTSGSPDPRAALAEKARTALQAGYNELGALQNTDGGFKYWEKQPSDVALTAYVLRFLNMAGEIITVDHAVVEKARDYLAANQAKSGAWTSHRWDLDKDVDDPNLTAYVARALAGMKSVPKAKETDKQRQAQASLKAALDFLEGRIQSWSDPYLVGNYAIAAIESGRPEHIDSAEFFLRRLAHREGDATYWNLEANTSPFYGWGLPGRLETTALAVKALAELQTKRPENDLPDMIGRGLQYLLTHKDRYSMWFSTQATQNVLEAMIAAMPATAESHGASEATLKINGRTVRSVPLPKAQDVAGPITLSLPHDLVKGANKIELVRPGGTGAMNTAVITSYYVGWADSEATRGEAFKAGETRALRLNVLYNHTEAKLGDHVHCSVEAERIGFRGYGMMLAEVGLPPGAEVDRASLDKAEASDAISGYEIQPDKVVFYVWPKAGGASFAFDFLPRYRINAMASPSVIYDYYNPEASATVAPVRFTVH